MNASSHSPETIIVEEGANLSRLCPGLARKDLIPGNCQTYRAMARLFGSGDPIQAGEFEIPKGMGGAARAQWAEHRVLEAKAALDSAQTAYDQATANR